MSLATTVWWCGISSLRPRTSEGKAYRIFRLLNLALCYNESGCNEWTWRRLWLNKTFSCQVCAPRALSQPPTTCWAMVRGTVLEGPLDRRWYGGWYCPQHGEVGIQETCERLFDEGRTLRAMTKGLRARLGWGRRAGAFFSLWHKLANIHLDPDRADMLVWRWINGGLYSSNSAYTAFFTGNNDAPLPTT
jgi:hypothetical protein